MLARESHNWEIIEAPPPKLKKDTKLSHPVLYCKSIFLIVVIKHYNFALQCCFLLATLENIGRGIKIWQRAEKMKRQGTFLALEIVIILISQIRMEQDLAFALASEQDQKLEELRYNL